jgi:uncharacterized protein
MTTPEFSLKSRLQGDLTVSRKSRDKLRTRVLSTVLSDLKNREIAAKAELDDAAVQEVVSRAIKQRKDAAEQMRGGGREDLAAGEEAEVALLVDYLPPQLSEEDVRTMIRDAVSGGADNMGAVMGRVMPQLKGCFDGKEANRLVREELGQ